MNVRTRETTVTFDHAFHLSDADGDLPAGTYRLVIDEEQLLGVSFLAYRRMATMLHTPALAAPAGRSKCLSVNAAELDAAVLKDQQTSARAGEAPSADALLL
ncbi:hypothetical protein [Xanthobacter sp. 126]|uniref:hypothetical protein n=1 Tax=Xanthobacter sp. 126 TaxID=1131814 RepID=UPI00045E5A2F|nr:hypothetical protein [Xanthobacter sp. 126]